MSESVNSKIDKELVKITETLERLTSAVHSRGTVVFGATELQLFNLSLNKTLYSLSKAKFVLKGREMPE